VRPRIFCVLKKSAEYDTDYVDHLRAGLGRELNVIEDSPWPRWFSKMSLFSPDVRGDILYFDLDTMIVGDISDLLSVNKLTVLADFNLPKPKFMATGVMFIPECERAEIWNAWISDPELHMKKHGSNGDGGFLSQFWKHKADRWQEVLPGQIVSYKVHWRKKENTSDARVLCFHGRPRPRELNWTV